MRRIVVATHSAHKLRELRQLLHLPHTRLLDLDDLGIAEEPVEDGPTFAANALLKARCYGRLAGLPTLADDSGLEVDALDGGPGVRTRRYAGEQPRTPRTTPSCSRSWAPCRPRGARRATYARWSSWRRPTREPLPARGEFEGRIALRPKGRGGFGYDPIFEPSSEPPGGRTVGQFSAAEKNAISHRAVAARAMGERLRALGY